MKGWKIFWGLAFIAVAVLLILNALGVLSPVSSVFGEITFWQIFGGVTLLVATISCIAGGELAGACILLGFIFLIFERNIAFVFFKGGNEDMINNWLVFGCSVLLGTGLTILKPKGKRKKSSKKSKGEKTEFHYKGNAMGASEIYVDCAEFGVTYTEQRVDNRIGAVEVNFENAECYRGGGTVNVSNSLGAIEIRVPKTWIVKRSISSSMGSIEEGEGNPEGEAPILTITGSNNLGAIEIERI